MKGVKCDESKKICFKFLKENPEGDSNQLIDQLKALKKSKQPEPTKIICHTCNTWGHDEGECWGQCEACKGWGHEQLYCPTVRSKEEKYNDKIAKAKARAKAKAKAKKAKAIADKTYFRTVVL